jgi:signal transduction histidine kinase
MQGLLSVDEVLAAVADCAREILHAHLAVASHGPEGTGATVRTHVSRSDSPNSGRLELPIPPEPGPWLEVIRDHRPVRRTGTQLRARHPPNEEGGDAGTAPRHGWLAVPLAGLDGHSSGVLQVADRRDGQPFTPIDEAVLAQLAEVASVAVENSLLHRASVEARAKLGWAAHVERVRAAELQAVIEAIGEAVLVFDSRGRVGISNPAADRLFAVQPVQTFDDLLTWFGRSPSEEPRGPVEVHVPDPPESWLELRVYPVPGPSARAEGMAPPGRIAVIRDVTAARRERAHREAFLGILSHELRTPITTIYAGSKVLARDEAISSRTRQELIADVGAEAERLFRLVEDLLVMTRSERGALDLAREPVLLQRVVAAAIRLERGHWPDTRIVLLGSTDLPAVAADALYVEQVVRNLLSNAAKYSLEGSDVEVILEERATEVAVRVLDRGRGFLSSEADDLFELFYRSPATAAQAAGAGIGLFVCRRLVAEMGGQIWARPRRGGGAEFGFTLPRYDDAD